ncbi:MAG: class I SAM-dependent methyltransferase [Ilumatobacteraceae bacterium]
MAKYLDDNRASWDDRAQAHAASPDYAFERFAADPHFLSEVVRFDRPLLGDTNGLRGVHLQCHIGTDTISLARLGAVMTGLDFSGASVVEARRLSALSGTPVDFVESNVYDALDVLRRQEFDLVYTGVGALCWLPDIRGWADVVAGLLCPGGRLFIREGHPMMWALDEARTEQLVIDYPYFERSEPLTDEDPGTYVKTDAQFTQNITHSWNHGLGEVVTALLEAGMRLTGLVEHDSVPWEALPGHMEKGELGEWSLADRPWRLACSYTLQAVKL